jgi:hypothetical protein
MKKEGNDLLAGTKVCMAILICQSAKTIFII